jgi:hypothetical protein
MTFHLQSINIQLQDPNSTIVEHTWNTSIVLVWFANEISHVFP